MGSSTRGPFDKPVLATFFTTHPSVNGSNASTSDLYAHTTGTKKTHADEYCSDILVATPTVAPQPNRTTLTHGLHRSHCIIVPIRLCPICSWGVFNQTWPKLCPQRHGFGQVWRGFDQLLAGSAKSGPPLPGNFGYRQFRQGKHPARAEKNRSQQHLGNSVLSAMRNLLRCTHGSLALGRKRELDERRHHRHHLMRQQRMHSPT